MSRRSRRRIRPSVPRALTPVARPNKLRLRPSRDIPAFLYTRPSGRVFSTHHPLFKKRIASSTVSPLIHTVLGGTNPPKNTITKQLNSTIAIPRSQKACLARHQRKEVLFAKRLTGKGSAAHTRNRNYLSSYRCK